MPRSLLDQNVRRFGAPQEEIAMSNVSLSFASQSSFFGRLMASVDRALMASARVAARNGDLPYFGL
jgi:hypothetical protein